MTLVLAPIEKIAQAISKETATLSLVYLLLGRYYKHKEKYIQLQITTLNRHERLTTVTQL